MGSPADPVLGPPDPPEVTTPPPSPLCDSSPRLLTPEYKNKHFFLLCSFWELDPVFTAEQEWRYFIFLFLVAA